MQLWLYNQYIKKVGLYVFDNYVPDSTRYLFPQAQNTETTVNNNNDGNEQ